MKKYGIRKVANFMFFLPTETQQDIWMNVEVARQWDIDSPNVGILYPYKATEIRKMAVEMGYVMEDELFRIEEEYNPYLTRSGTILRFDENYKNEAMHIYNNFSLYQILPKWQWSTIERAIRGDDFGLKLMQELRKVVYFKRYNEYPCF